MKNQSFTVFLSTFFIALLTFSACNLNDEVEDDKDGKEEEFSENCENTSDDGFKTVEFGSETREYILYEPANYDENVSSPLIINFHGFGGCAEDHADLVGNIFEMHSIADEHNFFIASPQGIVREKDGAEWDPGNNSSQNINENDPFFVEKLIENIDEEFNIDLNRVYAIGYSNGGMMAYGLACERPDLVAAIGIMSGISLGGDCIENEFTSLIHFHGIDDGVLPIEGNQDFASVNEGIDFWVAHNNISTESLVSTTLNNGAVLKEAFTGGSENTEAVLYTINSEFGKEGGHVWFSAPIDGKTPNLILWEFLSQFSLED